MRTPPLPTLRVAGWRVELLNWSQTKLSKFSILTFTKFSTSSYWELPKHVSRYLHVSWDFTFTPQHNIYARSISKINRMIC